MSIIYIRGMCSSCREENPEGTVEDVGCAAGNIFRKFSRKVRNTFVILWGEILLYFSFL